MPLVKRLNNIYKGMKARCYRSSCKDYKNYGGRGIKICEEWINTERVSLGQHYSNCSKGFLAFHEWSLSNGYKDNLTLDRIDVNQGYCPENCRCITAEEQHSNTRKTIIYKGERKTIKQCCIELGLNYNTVMSRINHYGWTIEKALT